MRIQHNIAALNSYRNLTGNNNSVSKNLEKLSSGYRINRAGDDAAGLAISEKMRAQITGLETAQKNANDGISLVQTAEGALTEVHSMLNRMVELADQSANGTYQDKVDRENLQKEMVSLRDEIDRISEGTNFNGINLLDGSLSGGANGVGGLTGATIATFKPATFTIAGKDATGGAVNFAHTDTLNIDGNVVTVDWSGLSTEEKAKLEVDFTGATADQTKAAAEVMQNTINKAIDKANADNGSNIQHITVAANATNGSFDFTSGLKGTGSSKIEHMSASGDSSVLVKAAGTTAGTTKASAAATLKVVDTDLKGKFTMTIDGEEIEVDTSTSTITNASNVASGLQSAIDAALAKYDTAKGTTGTSDAINGKIKVALNNKGQLEFTNTSGTKIGFADKNGGEFAKNFGISAEGKASNGGLTLQIGDTADDFNKLTVSVDSMSSASLGIASLNIGTQAGAAAAVDQIKTAINTVSSTRGDLGALQNRLEHTINNLSVTTENMTAAESRIRDVDMASEMMSYTKNNILVQASQAMLAQANQIPQGVLQLLQ